ncbi:oxidoreductase-like domain-containing protein [Moraxella sp. ZJ142]|uniref:oxidoreductase-like domain-containing protein n=1 Tax=Moraxella marmotae TaxID=3344520 RepID=UPI0035D40A27
MSETDFGEVLLPQPDYPEDWECCNSECGDACVYQLYQQDKQAYDAQQARLKAFLATNAQKAEIAD